MATKPNTDPTVGAPSDADKRQAEALKAEAEAKKAADKAKADAEKQAKADKAEANKKSLTYLRSPEYAGLTIVKEDGTTVRFVPYYDTFKGDKVKVGFLATDDDEIVKRCESLGNIEVIDEKEFTKETESLEKAPAYS